MFTQWTTTDLVNIRVRIFSLPPILYRTSMVSLAFGTKKAPAAVQNRCLDTFASVSGRRFCILSGGGYDL